MLNPNQRSLYTTALNPPPGFAFDGGVGTSFSVEPLTLLTVPVHLALLGLGTDRKALGDEVAVLEAMRRLASRLVVFHQRGRMLLPRAAGPMLSLLEPVAIEVLPPGAGVFHPKLWLLRFRSEGGAVAIRLLVLSRNLTPDRSWDLLLQMDGERTGRIKAGNAPLARLFRALPGMAVGEVPESRARLVEELVSDLERTPLEPPKGFAGVSFHVLGLDRKGWRPPECRQMGVVSPFCSDEALMDVTLNAQRRVFLLSRPETIEALSPRTRQAFERLVVLDDRAEADDGEEAANRDVLGLHAKVYLYREGFTNHVVMGSANATDAALVARRNVEVLVDLSTEGERAPGPEAFLGAEGAGECLQDWGPAGTGGLPDPETERRRKILEAAREGWARQDLWIRCVRTEPGGGTEAWALELGASGTVEWPQGIRVTAWPLTQDPSVAVDVTGADLAEGRLLGTFSTVSLTGLTGFRLALEPWGESLAFGLNLPVRGMPEDREAALVSTIVRNREGFLRYLLMLLGDPDDSAGATRGLAGLLARGAAKGWEDMPLLEELVRTWSRHPERLDDVRAVVAQLQRSPDADRVIPDSFRELWAVFEKALSEDAR